jgi:sugar phosphate permease
MDAVKRYVTNLPVLAMVIVLVGQLVGSLVAAFAAAKIGRSRVPAYVIGALLLVAGVASTLMIPQPLWFVVFELLAYIGATIIGARTGAPAAPLVRA